MTVKQSGYLRRFPGVAACRCRVNPNRASRPERTFIALSFLSFFLPINGGPRSPRMNRVRARPIARRRWEERQGNNVFAFRRHTQFEEFWRPCKGQASRCRATSKRSGKPCRSPAVRGKAVCRMHGAGGGAPKGNANALKHGLYTTQAVNQRRAASILARYSKRFVVGLMPPAATRS